MKRTFYRPTHAELKAWLRAHKIAGGSSIPNQAPVIAAASGAIAPSGAKTIVAITKAGVAAMTLPAPTVDGQILVIFDAGGHAHTVTVNGGLQSPPVQGLNGGTTNNLLTFGGTIGQSVELTSYNSNWWTTAVYGVTPS